MRPLYDFKKFHENKNYQNDHFQEDNENQIKGGFVKKIRE